MLKLTVANKIPDLIDFLLYRNITLNYSKIEVSDMNSELFLILLTISEALT